MKNEDTEFFVCISIFATAFVTFFIALSLGIYFGSRDVYKDAMKHNAGHWELENNSYKFKWHEKDNK